MKITKQLLISLVLLLSACMPAQDESPAEATTAPEPTPAVLQTSPKDTTAPAAREEPDEPAESVEFEPGITSTTRSGSLTEGGHKEYVLAVATGQRMHIQTVGYDAPVHFSLRSPGGETWSGEPQASDVFIFAIQVVLPENGDYFVMLSVPPGMGGTRYVVPFTIEDDWQPSEQPERVDFANGTNSTRYSSLLPSGLSIKQYVLGADRGQIITVDIASDDVPVGLTITSPSGILLFSESLQADGSSRGGNVLTLFESGDYLITLTKAEHTPSTNYTVDITIE